MRQSVLSRDDVSHKLATGREHVYAVVRVIHDEYVPVDVAAYAVRLEQLVRMLAAWHAVACGAAPRDDVEYLDVRRDPIGDDDLSVACGTHIVRVGDQVSTVIPFPLDDVLQRPRHSVIELHPPVVTVDDHEPPVRVDGDAPRVLVVAAQRRHVIPVRREDADLFRAAIADRDVAVLENTHIERAH